MSVWIHHEIFLFSWNGLHSEAEYAVDRFGQSGLFEFSRKM